MTEKQFKKKFRILFKAHDRLRGTAYNMQWLLRDKGILTQEEKDLFAEALNEIYGGYQKLEKMLAPALGRIILRSLKVL